MSWVVPLVRRAVPLTIWVVPITTPLSLPLLLPVISPLWSTTLDKLLPIEQHWTNTLEYRCFQMATARVFDREKRFTARKGMHVLPPTCIT
jgi:Mlc titration factor MtfA (ptsG expression regulator)